MATRIEHCFVRLRAQGQKGFIAYITAGDPSLRATQDIVLRLEDAGVDLVELGIPFSDPLADGKVIQLASARALAAGTTLARLLEAVAALRRRTEIPLLLFSYLNPLLAHGFGATARRAARAGADGFLVLDLPVEEAADGIRDMERHGLNHVGLVTPTTPPARIRRIVRASTGFVYCVSREGVTGVRDRLERGALELVRLTRRFTRLPVALGFGIATPDKTRAAARSADAVVVGSAIVDRFHAAPRSAAGRAAAARWVRTLVRSVKGV